MSIRVLDHKGTAHQLSARMTADFQSELRRIGEAPSSPTVNLWISNQPPEELLEILRRMPDRPAGDPKSDVEAAVKAPHRPEISTPSGNSRLQRRVYEGVYQCDTGRIDADSGGEGRWVIRDAKYVKLSKEEEMGRERRDVEDGCEDGGEKRGGRSSGGGTSLDK